MPQQKTVRLFSAFLCATAFFTAANAAAQTASPQQAVRWYPTNAAPPAPPDQAPPGNGANGQTLTAGIDTVSITPSAPALAQQQAQIPVPQEQQPPQVQPVQPQPAARAVYPNPYVPSYTQSSAGIIVWRQPPPQPQAAQKAVYYFAPGSSEPVLKQVSASGEMVAPPAAADEQPVIVPPPPPPEHSRVEGSLGTISMPAPSVAAAAESVALPNASAAAQVPAPPPPSQTVYYYPAKPSEAARETQQASIVVPPPPDPPAFTASSAAPNLAPSASPPGTKGVYYFAPGSSDPVLTQVPLGPASAAASNMPGSAMPGLVQPGPNYAYGQQAYAAPALHSPDQTAPLLAQAEPPEYMGIETRRGIDIGVQESYYRYREPEVDVTLLGGMTGITAQGIYTFGNGYFAGVDGRYAFGWVDYRGSGTATGNFNQLWDVRATGGKDFNFEYFTLAPYTGFGYRDLYEDGRGLSSIGDFGYRRENHLFYMPLGLYPRFRLSEQARIAAMIEYDAVLLGVQDSDLADGGQGDPNVSNRQTSGGSGVRGEVMYETPTWAVGPFFNYWDIGQSVVKTFLSSNPATCAPGSAPCVASGVEPRNHTTEGGIQFRYHFY